MTRIDFYILKEGSKENRFSLACRLVDKAWQQGQRVLVLTAEEEHSQHMDRLLWTFRQDSFLPHGRLHQADPELTPILIGHQEDGGSEHQILINLTDHIPAIFSRFERLLEVVEREAISAGRERFRHYRERGYDIGHHEV